MSDTNESHEVCCSGTHGLCRIPPSPKARERLHAKIQELNAQASGMAKVKVGIDLDGRPGLNDGLIIPGAYFPAGTPLHQMKSQALQRAPLRGDLRVAVVLVDFSDRPMVATRQHFEQLFFSTGVIPTGSVREYFKEVSGDKINLTGEVVGPYRLPQTLATYAHGASGTGGALPNARTMARDAAMAANADVDFSVYDNDGNGFVDAFIVIHAGAGAEQTLEPGDIWSHKWLLPNGELDADGTKIYAYLTVPEDSKIGVCAHELGHLLFGWPDLYDTDGSSEGLGNWCLMAGGSWNGDGDTPAHPSAWCKANQGWVNVVNHTATQTVTFQDVKLGQTVHRLWKNGSPGNEYFLVENRQRTHFDRLLPGEGLLVFHIDESIESNTNEAHAKIALEQADGNNHLALAKNRGDAGDPFPGTSNARTFNATSNPNSKTYGGVDTSVSITSISDPGPAMTAHVAVRGKVKEKTGRESWRDAFDELRGRVAALESAFGRIVSFGQDVHPARPTGGGTGAVPAAGAPVADKGTESP